MPPIQGKTKALTLVAYSLLICTLIFGLQACDSATEYPEEENVYETEAEEEIEVDPGANLANPGANQPMAGGQPNEVQVSLTEFEIDMPSELPAGQTILQVSNDGQAEHNLEVEGQGIEKELDSNLTPGESGTLQVDLKPGTYRVYCPVGNHASQGMEMQLTVTAQG